MIVDKDGEFRPVEEWSIRDRIGYALGKNDSDRTIDAILSAIPDEALIKKASRCDDPDHKEDCAVCAARKAGIEAYLKLLLAQRAPRPPWMWSVF